MNVSVQNEVLENNDNLRGEMATALVLLNKLSVPFLLNSSFPSLDLKNMIDFYCCHPISLLYKFIKTCQKHEIPTQMRIFYYRGFKTDWPFGMKQTDENTEECKV